MSPNDGDHEPPRSDTPPAASEDIHLPGPSYLPVIVAAGVSLALVGVLVSPYLLALGMIVWIVATLVWVRDARGEIAELPLDHGS